MTIPTKTLIAFVFSVIFIISYVRCATTTASAPGRGGPADATGTLYQPFSNLSQTF